VYTNSNEARKGEIFHQGREQEERVAPNNFSLSKSLGEISLDMVETNRISLRNVFCALAFFLCSGLPIVDKEGSWTKPLV